jgi:peptide/nickel transport system substrate-binding protein
VQKKLILVLLLVSFFCFATSCDIADKNMQDANKNKATDLYIEPQRGGTLNLFSTVPDTFNPLLSGNIFIKDYSYFLYDGMFKLTSSQEVKGSLVKNYQVSSDGLIWTFKTIDNCFWHDGVKFSAHDIEFTFNTILNQNLNSIYKENLRYIIAYSAIDENTFRIVLQRQDTFLPWRLTFPIISKHFYTLQQDFENDKKGFPIGTGAFKFLEYKQNEYIRLQANDNWWGINKKDKSRKPYLEEINIKVGTNVNNVGELFSNSDVDVILLKNGFWGNYIGRRDIIFQKYPSNKFEFIAFNIHGNSWISEKNVRKAINLCIDRRELINAVIPGEATPSDIPFYPEFILNEGSLFTYTENREKAIEILKKDGWKYDGQSNLYREINGSQNYLRIEMTVNRGNQVRLSIAKNIKEQLKSIGIDINIKEIDDDIYFNILQQKSFEMSLSGIRVSGYPDLGGMYSNENQSVNISGFDNFEMNNLIGDLMSLDSLGKKKFVLKNIREILEEEVPYCGLFFLNDAIIYSKKIKGNIDPCDWNRLNDITTWYFNN